MQRCGEHVRISRYPDTRKTCPQKRRGNEFLFPKGIQVTVEGLVATGQGHKLRHTSMKWNMNPLKSFLLPWYFPLMPLISEAQVEGSCQGSRWSISQHCGSQPRAGVPRRRAYLGMCAASMVSRSPCQSPRRKGRSLSQQTET